MRMKPILNGENQETKRDKIFTSSSVTEGILRIVRKYYEQLYAKILDNLGKMDELIKCRATST